MILEIICVGPLDVNCYLAGSSTTREVFIIDPGDDLQKVRDKIVSADLIPRAIINTHGHIDHAGGVSLLKEQLGIPYYLHEAECPLLEALPAESVMFGLNLTGIPKPDMLLHDDQTLCAGDTVFKVIHTPGHSPGGICLLSGGNLFSGDTLFAGSVGRGDLPGGNFHQVIHSIKNKLLCLDDQIVVYPGHGPTTSIGREKRYNPYLTGHQ
jgi:hydroxyacylglutathione hydrolase